jgi:peptidoglycan/xylan/chitin deacetylase (PgdA/CDA1 family)
MNFRIVSRDIIANLLSLIKVTGPSNCHGDKLLIITFHRVLPENERKQYPYPGLVVTPEELRWFVNYFQRYYTCGQLSEMHTRYSDGERPKKPFLAITFDDGQLDNYRYAKPVLDEFNIKASFFIPVKHIEESIPIWHDHLGFAVINAIKTKKGKQALKNLLYDNKINVESGLWTSEIVRGAKQMMPNERYNFINKINALSNFSIPEWAKLMDWNQIRELDQSGHEIGSHTMTHTLLPQCNDTELEFELVESKKILEQRIDNSIDSFCYPNGDHDQRTIKAVQLAGYQCAITTSWGTNTSLNDIYALKRCDMDAHRARGAFKQLSEATLALRLSGFHPGL